MTHTRSAVALGVMLMATAASAHVQNGNFETDLNHWKEHGHKRTLMGTAANPKIPKNFADLGLTDTDTGIFLSKEILQNPPQCLVHVSMQWHPHRP